MKLKFTWGTGIFITIAVFVSFFISFLIFSLSRDVNLVTKNYFPDEIAYDVKINKMQNTNALKEKVHFKLQNRVLKITFPPFIKNPEKVKGSVLFFYIKSRKKDKSFNLKLDKNNAQFFDLTDYSKGRYTVKIDWSYKNKGYFQEHIIELK